MALNRTATSRPVLSDSSGVPLYRQVESDLAHRIESGEWSPGSQIPSEPTLCSHYNVSRVTMREAVLRLVQQGMLVREQGRGTFVREPRLVAGARRVTSFTEELGELGLRAGSRVLEQRVTTAQAAGATDSLSIGAEAHVFEVRRLRTANGVPMGIQRSVLPLDRFPDLPKLELEGRSLYGVLNQHYGVVAEEAHETFSVDLASPEQSSLLELPSGSPVFNVHRVSFAIDGPFELVRSVMRGDRYQVHLHLHQRNP